MKLNKEQIDFLNDCTNADGSWTLNEKTGLVDIDGSFNCDSKKLKDFKGVKFGVVGGDFNCSYNSLTSLVGAPKEVGGCFLCYDNKLTSLEGAPQVVRGSFLCNRNKLTSLEGAPQEVGGYFYCSYNKLPIPKSILDLILKTMKDKGVNYQIALLLNKESIKEKINKHREQIEKLESAFTELDKHLSKDAQKGISMLDRFKVFE